MKNAESEANRLLVKRFYEEIIGQAKPSSTSLTKSSRRTLHGMTLSSHGIEVRGIEAFKQVLVMFRSAFPDLEIKLEDQFAHDDRVASRFTIRGT